MVFSLQQPEFLVICLICSLLVLFLVLLFVVKQSTQIAKLQSTVELFSTSQNNVLAQYFDKQQLQLSSTFEQKMADLRIKLLRELNSQKEQLNQNLSQNQNQTLEQLISHLNKTTQANREELSKSLMQSSEQMTKRIDVLTQATDKRLQEISGQVEKRLAEGFEKTTKTFSDILQRLALIDDAQKKITELSTNVVSLQEVLNDKRSRGAFGEVQLNSLIRNVLPEQSFKLQHTLSNGKIADCVLFLPKPTGNVVVDSKLMPSWQSGKKKSPS